MRDAKFKEGDIAIINGFDPKFDGYKVRVIGQNFAQSSIGSKGMNMFYVVRVLSEVEGGTVVNAIVYEGNLTFLTTPQS